MRSRPKGEPSTIDDDTAPMDPYEVLQLHPKAHPLLVMRAFRVLAAMSHPDNKQTGDRVQFERVMSAYRMLSDPVQRAAYDRAQGRAASAGTPTLAIVEPSRATAPDERRLRTLILTTLYNARRNSFSSPGLSLWVLTDMTDSHLEDVQFSLWYLRGRKLIEMVDNDTMAITVAGVDYVESHGNGISEELLALPDGRGMLNATS